MDQHGLSKCQDAEALTVLWGVIVASDIPQPELWPQCNGQLPVKMSFKDEILSHNHCID